MISCGSKTKTELVNDNNSKKIIELPSNYLVTGWYFIEDEKTDLERKLFKSEDSYYLNPKPIITNKNFTKLEIYKSNYGDLGLSIRFDNYGTELWSEATTKAFARIQKLGIIVDNQLISVADIANPIFGGISAINRGDLTKEELLELKKKIESN